MYKWSGKTTSFHHKWNDTPNPSDVDEGFRPVWFLDVQWSTCPIEVEDEIRQMWIDGNGLGNDNYIVKTRLNYLKDDEDLPLTLQYISEVIAEKGYDVGEDDLIIIHWWW